MTKETFEERIFNSVAVNHLDALFETAYARRETLMTTFASSARAGIKVDLPLVSALAGIVYNQELNSEQLAQLNSNNKDLSRKLENWMSATNELLTNLTLLQRKAKDFGKLKDLLNYNL